MAIRTYEITLDAKNDILPEIIFGRQGDKTGAVQINGTIIDGGVPYNLTGKSLVFKATTAKGTAVVVDSNNFNIVDASNGKFTYLIPNALWNEAGRIDNAYFSVYDDNEAQAESTLGLIFVVKKAIDMTQESANDYITIVDQTLQSLTANIGKLQNQVNAITNAYEAGEFYNKSEIDTKVNSVKNEITSEVDEKVKAVQDDVDANEQTMNDELTVLTAGQKLTWVDLALNTSLVTGTLKIAPAFNNGVYFIKGQINSVSDKKIKSGDVVADVAGTPIEGLHWINTPVVSSTGGVAVFQVAGGTQLVAQGLGSNETGQMNASGVFIK